jgi:hypothetical protein
MAIEEIIDRLYGLPLEQFTQERNEAASELRKAGQRDEAGRVRALRKPTTAAAAVNRLVREQRGEVERFLRVAAELRDAQFSGKGDLAVARRQEQEELAALIRIGGEDVRQSLLAAAVDDDAARQLLEARLERELEPRGFGTLLVHAPSAPARPVAASAEQTKQGQPSASKPDEGESPTGPGRATASQMQPTLAEGKKPDHSAARARLREMRVALSVAETEERQARRRLAQSQKEAEKARASVEKARASVEEAQKALEKAHAVAEETQAAAEAARTAVGEWAATAEDAKAAVEKAQRDLDGLQGR